ncbi:basic proline-rich protein-like [Calypte anna]|uniref:basic proline-rich protein-like n=1 Tax=Calypte anna TaxID=9244 RepID=UPI0011C34CA4|nr:basic proline-rich protein-like [Calypte anna]
MVMDKNNGKKRNGKKAAVCRSILERQSRDQPSHRDQPSIGVGWATNTIPVAINTSRGLVPGPGASPSHRPSCRSRLCSHRGSFGLKKEVSCQSQVWVRARCCRPRPPVGETGRARGCSQCKPVSPVQTSAPSTHRSCFSRARQSQRGSGVSVPRQPPWEVPERRSQAVPSRENHRDTHTPSARRYRAGPAAPDPGTPTPQLLASARGPPAVPGKSCQPGVPAPAPEPAGGDRRGVNGPGSPSLDPVFTPFTRVLPGFPVPAPSRRSEPAEETTSPPVHVRNQRRPHPQPPRSTPGRTAGSRTRSSAFAVRSTPGGVGVRSAPCVEPRVRRWQQQHREQPCGWSSSVRTPGLPAEESLSPSVPVPSPPLRIRLREPLTQRPLAGASGSCPTRQRPLEAATPPGGRERLLPPWTAPPSGCERLLPSPTAPPCGRERLLPHPTAPLAAASGFCPPPPPLTAPPGGREHLLPPGTAPPSGCERLLPPPPPLTAPPSGRERLLPPGTAPPSSCEQLLPPPLTAPPSGCERLLPHPTAPPSGCERLLPPPLTAPPGGRERLLLHPTAPPSGCE